MPNNQYDVILANNEELRKVHYELRYRVFCLETGFEDTGDFPDQQEQDEWDCHAQHFLVRARDTGEWVATMRLVLPREATLPIHSHNVINLTDRPAINQCAELSRLCIIGHHRPRVENQVLPFPGVELTDQQQRRHVVRVESKKRKQTAEILKALLDASVAYSYEKDIRYWYMLTTQSMARVAARTLPMDFLQIGDPCQHRGERFPFLVDLDRVITEMTKDVWTGTVQAQLDTCARPNAIPARSATASAI